MENIAIGLGSLHRFWSEISKNWEDNSNTEEHPSSNNAEKKIPSPAYECVLNDDTVGDFTDILRDWAKMGETHALDFSKVDANAFKQKYHDYLEQAAKETASLFRAQHSQATEGFQSAFHQAYEKSTVENKAFLHGFAYIPQMKESAILKKLYQYTSGQTGCGSSRLGIYDKLSETLAKNDSDPYNNLWHQSVAPVLKISNFLPVFILLNKYDPAENVNEIEMTNSTLKDIVLEFTKLLRSQSITSAFLPNETENFYPISDEELIGMTDEQLLTLSLMEIKHDEKLSKQSQLLINVIQLNLVNRIITANNKSEIHTEVAKNDLLLDTKILALTELQKQYSEQRAVENSSDNISSSIESNTESKSESESESESESKSESESESESESKSKSKSESESESESKSKSESKPEPAVKPIDDELILFRFKEAALLRLHKDNAPQEAIDSIEEFTKKATQILRSTKTIEEKKQAIRKEAHQKFEHRNPLFLRLIADALMILTWLFGGFMLGMERKNAGKPMFFSSSKTQREIDLLNIINDDKNQEQVFVQPSLQ